MVWNPRLNWKGKIKRPTEHHCLWLIASGRLRYVQEAASYITLHIQSWVFSSSEEGTTLHCLSRLTGNHPSKLFYEVLAHTLGDLSFLNYQLLNSSPPNISSMAVKFQHMNFERDIQNIWTSEEIYIAFQLPYTASDFMLVWPLCVYKT